MLTISTHDTFGAYDTPCCWSTERAKHTPKCGGETTLKPCITGGSSQAQAADISSAVAANQCGPKNLAPVPVKVRDDAAGRSSQQSRHQACIR